MHTTPARQITIGVIGESGVGKTTFIRSLTSSSGGASKYPFTSELTCLWASQTNGGLIANPQHRHDVEQVDRVHIWDTPGFLPNTTTGIKTTPAPSCFSQELHGVVLVMKLSPDDLDGKKMAEQVKCVWLPFIRDRVSSLFCQILVVVSVPAERKRSPKLTQSLEKIARFDGVIAGTACGGPRSSETGKTGVGCGGAFALLCESLIRQIHDFGKPTVISAPQHRTTPPAGRREEEVADDDEDREGSACSGYWSHLHRRRFSSSGDVAEEEKAVRQEPNAGQDAATKKCNSEEVGSCCFDGVHFCFTLMRRSRLGQEASRSVRLLRRFLVVNGFRM